MFLALQIKALDFISNLHRNERGQTATEYVAVLVVAVGLAIGVLWLLLSGVLTTVITNIGDNLESFSDSILPN